jgi:hypothetical protein
MLVTAADQEDGQVPPVDQIQRVAKFDSRVQLGYSAAVRCSPFTIGNLEHTS